MIYLLILNWQGAVKICDVQRQVWFLLYEWAYVSSLTLFTSDAFHSLVIFFVDFTFIFSCILALMIF